VNSGAGGFDSHALPPQHPPRSADTGSHVRGVPDRDFAAAGRVVTGPGRYLAAVKCLAPRWCAALVAGLVAGALLGEAARAQGADACANAVDAGVGSVQVPYDTLVCSDTGAPATSQPTAPQPCASLGADVWFRWTATRTGATRFALCGSSFDCKLGLWRGTACGSLVPLACNDDSCGLQSELVLPLTLGQEYFVQIGFFTATYPLGTHVWGAGTLAITELSPVPNDTCATPTVFPLGVDTLPFDTGGATTSGFNGGGGCFATTGPDVFFEWTAQVAGAYEFRTCGASGDTVVAVHRGLGCNAVCEASNDDSCGLQSAAQVLGIQPGDSFLVQVAGYQGARPSGVLTVAAFTPAACVLNDDPFEDNDVCNQAWPLGDGTYPGLVCRQDDNDFFAAIVPAGSELLVAALFDDSRADLDLYLWAEPAIGASCGTATNGVGAGNGSLAAALSATNNEVLTYRNTSSVPETILIELDFYSSGTQTCNVYDLTLIGTGPAPIGTAFCDVLPNSSGAVGVLWVTQTPVVQDPTLRIHVAPLPLGSFGFMLMSRGTTAGVPISAGRLCLDLATLLRFQQTLVNSGAFGSVSFPFPWQNAPVQILVGETWHFQYWHRDVLGGIVGANFSRGLSLQF